jgi:hypothetical protein
MRLEALDWDGLSLSFNASITGALFILERTYDVYGISSTTRKAPKAHAYTHTICMTLLTGK